jgi:hypothetical protein
MRIIKLAWVGTRTDNAAPTVAFFRDVLGLRLELEHPGFWMLKLRRPWGSARTPQPMQPTTAAVVWTASCHSPPTTSAARTWKPSRSSSLEAEALLCWPTWGLLLADVRHPQAMQVPGAILAAPTSPSATHHPTLHDEEPANHLP